MCYHSLRNPGSPQGLRGTKGPTRKPDPDNAGGGMDKDQ